MAPFAYLKTTAEIFLTLLILWRASSFFLRRPSPLLLLVLGFAAVLFFEKDALAALPYFKTLFPPLLLALWALIVLSPEIERLLGRFKTEEESYELLLRGDVLEEMVRACQTLAASRTGALLAVQRHDDLAPFIQRSVVIDAKIRHELLLTIFTPPTYLHDGGVIIRGDRIVSCSAIFPLSENPKIKKDLGTRHRAALGMSEDTDALCLVVSEESGTISVADRGNLYYGIEPSELKETLERLLRFKKIKTPSYAELVYA